MPTGQEFSKDVKQIIFNVIKFVEKEKFGPVIPLLDVNERLSSMLDISVRSITRLKSEMREIEHDMMEKKRKMDEEKQKVENQKLQVLSRLRNLPRRSSSLSSSSTININTTSIDNPAPNSPRKLLNPGRPPATLNEQQQGTIR